MKSRPASLEDADAIARIYNQGIEDRVATFETQSRTARDVIEVMGSRGDRYPTVVVLDGAHIIAAGWASPYRPRPCYDGIAEFSVYVERTSRRRGAGRLAMEALIDECRHHGFWKLVSRVFPENVPSRNLLTSLGFREVGVYKRHAKLDDVWRDCVVVELLVETA